MKSNERYQAKSLKEPPFNTSEVLAGAVPELNKETLQFKDVNREKPYSF